MDLEKPQPSFFLVVTVFTSLTGSLSFEVGFVLAALFNEEEQKGKEKFIKVKEKSLFFKIIQNMVIEI